MAYMLMLVIIDSYNVFVFVYSFKLIVSCRVSLPWRYFLNSVIRSSLSAKVNFLPSSFNRLIFAMVQRTNIFLLKAINNKICARYNDAESPL